MAHNPGAAFPPNDGEQASGDDPASSSSVNFSSTTTTRGREIPFQDTNPSSTAPPLSQTSLPSQQSPKSRRVPSFQGALEPQPATGHMSSSSSVSGTLSNARRPTPSAGNLPLDIMQKARALQQQRMGMSPHNSGHLRLPNSPTNAALGPRTAVGGAMAGEFAPNLRLPPNMSRNMARPSASGFPRSAPAVPTLSGRLEKPSLSERRAMKLGQLPGSAGSTSPLGKPPRLSDMGDATGSSGSRPSQSNTSRNNSRMSDFKHYIDAERGWITFEGAATITRTGVNFAGGHTFKISLDEIQVMDELGKGNYGTVYKVRHARPPVPRFGPGLSGFKPTHGAATSTTPASTMPLSRNLTTTTQAVGRDALSDSSGGVSPAVESKALATGTTGKVMAMKEIRLELDEAKFGTILKELVILHECVSPYVIDFYGAFFQEGAVYMCIEYMDGGSIDKLYTGGIPEPVLRKISYRTVMGLKTLKDEHNIIHRDVKPTNILANTNGQIKICDFGVSGNLVASIAKTNIGCQSYMAPERITGGGMAPGANAEGTYSVQSDIWSLGLTIIECAMGRYPYPPEVSSTIFSQLSAIVNGEPPDMPDSYSDTAKDFVRSCLNKNPTKRFTYLMLLNHPWLKGLSPVDSIIEETEDPVDSSSASNDAVDRASKGIGNINLVDGPSSEAHAVAGDSEVSTWVIKAMEKKCGGLPTSGAKPALHAAPLAP